MVYAVVLFYTRQTDVHNYPDTNPAPNQYHVRHKCCSSLPTAPSYSLGQRLPPSGGRSVSPSPAEYLPRPPSTLSAPITPRRSKKEGTVNISVVTDSMMVHCHNVAQKLLGLVVAINCFFLDPTICTHSWVCCSCSQCLCCGARPD